MHIKGNGECYRNLSRMNLCINLSFYFSFIFNMSAFTYIYDSIEIS